MNSIWIGWSAQKIASVERRLCDFWAFPQLDHLGDFLEIAEISVPDYWKLIINE